MVFTAVCYDIFVKETLYKQMRVNLDAKHRAAIFFESGFDSPFSTSSRTASCDESKRRRVRAPAAISCSWSSEMPSAG